MLHYLPGSDRREQENLDDHDSAYDDDHVALLFTIRFFELLREVTNCPPDRRNMDIAITPKLGDFIDRGSRFLDEISHVCPQRNRRPVVSFAVARTNPTPIPTDRKSTRLNSSH